VKVSVRTETFIILIVASCWFFLSSYFAHDARSQEPKVVTFVLEEANLKAGVLC